MVFMQVLAQLHGLSSEDGIQEDGHEDAQPSSRGNDHRRPKSAGNLADHAAGTTNNSQKSGRPPLAETTANNKIGLKVERCHQLSQRLVHTCHKEVLCL